MLENIVKKIKHISLVGLTALALNCDNGTSNSVQCNTNSDCQSGYQCIANKCELMPQNKAPIANAGEDQPLNFDAACFDNNAYNNGGLCPFGYNIKNNINPNQKITLDGSLSSDPEGKILQYLWRQISGPNASLSNNTIAKPEVIPYTIGDYGFGLEVSDGEKTSAEDASTLYVRKNVDPVAQLTAQKIYGELCPPTGEHQLILRMDGSQSYDADGSITECSWNYGGDYYSLVGGQWERFYFNRTYTETTINFPDGAFDCKYEELITNCASGAYAYVNQTVKDDDGSTNSTYTEASW